MDLKKLNSLILESGYKRWFVAQKLGISSNSLLLKLKGKYEFKASELKALAQVLGLDKETRDKIFFDE